MRSPLLVVALTATLSVAPFGVSRAQSPEPSAEFHPNPFCAVRAEAVGWNPGAGAAVSGPTATYRLQLASQAAGKNLDAHVVLVDEAGLYHARVRSAPLTGTPYAQQTPAYLVTFPKPVSVDYAYVSEYFVDDSPQVACRKQIVPVPKNLDVRFDAPAAGRAIAAAFDGPLPALPCGKIYTPPYVTKLVKPDTLSGMGQSTAEYHYHAESMAFDPSEYDFRTERHASVRVFLDAQGVPAGAYVEDISDKSTATASLTAAQETVYAPATFLCAPVVSTYVFELDMGATAK